MKTTVKKLLAVFLSLIFLIGVLPVYIPAATSATITEGVYLFKVNLGTDMILEVANASKKDKGNIQIYKKTGTAAQMFKIQKSGSYYKISNVNSGKFLSIASGSKESKANVQQYKWTGAKSQLWRFVNSGNGTYCIINVGSGKALAIAGTKATNGTNVWQYTLTKKNSQKWALVPVTRVTSISLSKSNATLYKGKSLTLTATVRPTNATTKTVTWKSSNTNVATVSGTGIVSAVGAGKATITATTNDGNKKASCEILVKEKVVTPTKAPTPIPTPGPSSGRYVLNTSTKKFHYHSCSAAAKIKPENLGYSNESRDELMNRGYSPCGICDP